MGVGALLLAVEAGSKIKAAPSSGMTQLPSGHEVDDAHQDLELVWPIVCFTVFSLRCGTWVEYEYGEDDQGGNATGKEKKAGDLGYCPYRIRHPVPATVH
jgi:hypothetical protein